MEVLKNMNSIDNINFKGFGRNIKMLLPRKLVGYSTHTPKQAELPYGYYMNRDKAKEKNLLVESCKKIEDLYQKSYLRFLLESFRK